MKTRHWVSAAIAVMAVPAVLVGGPAALGGFLGSGPAVSVADNDEIVPSGGPITGTTGWVYVLSNQESGNSVIIFERDADGGLVRKGIVPTGGLGAGRGHDLEDASDALVSQGALIASPDRKFLFAVDAGSNEVSSLSVDGGKVELVSRVPSGGTRPVSVALHDDLLYVANAGGLAPNTNGPSASVAGFKVDGEGKLTAIDGAVTNLPGGPMAAPSQVSFNPAGTKLVVTERQANKIDVFPIGEDGKLGTGVSNKSSGPGPFTATFRGKDTLVSSEVVGSNYKYGALSTYKLKDDNTLEVMTASLSTVELAACWTVDSLLDPNVLYLGNAQSGTISGIRFDKDGKASVFPDDGHLATTRDQKATQDMALSANGRYLYVLTVGFDEKLADPRLITHVDGAQFSNKMSISAWRVEKSGALTPLPGYGVADDVPTVVTPGVVTESKGGLPPGSEGIVAF